MRRISQYPSLAQYRIAKLGPYVLQKAPVAHRLITLNNAFESYYVVVPIGLPLNLCVLLFPQLADLEDSDLREAGFERTGPDWLRLILSRCPFTEDEVTQIVNTLVGSPKLTLTVKDDSDLPPEIRDHYDRTRRRR